MALMKNMINGVIGEVGAGSYNGTGLGDAPVTGNTMYDQLYAANPYRGLTYNKSWWQSLLESMGFRTSYDTWREQAQVNANEYDARIAELMQQNEFNDPSAQAARERLAGINPDLLGIGDVAEAASQAPDPNGMQPNPADDFQQFGETFMGVLGKTLTLYRDFKGLSELDNLIEAGDLDNVKRMYESIDSFVQSRFQEGDFNNRSSYLKAVSRIKGELEDELMTDDYASSSAFRIGIDRKNWRRWSSLAGDYLDGLMGDKSGFSAFTGAGNARASATESKLNPLYTKSDDVDDTMTGISVIISDNYSQILQDKSKNDAYAEALRTGALENQGIQQDIENQYLDQMNEGNAGVKQARSELAKYDAEWYAAQLKARTDSMQEQILDFLRNKARTSRFASLMLMNWSLNNMVNMGINANASASVGLNFGLGANIANTVSTIFKP